MSFTLTAKQLEANALLASPATHIMLEGGSRSGKTFLAVRAIVTRGIKAPDSRHAILRYRFNAVKQAIVYDTFPKVMSLCYPEVKYELSKSDWYAQLQTGSQIWFGGLDDKERTEKILGQEFATIFLNECSQIPWASRNIAVTRLAQQTLVRVNGMPAIALSRKMYYDENPPSKGHWSYRVFHQKLDPETRLGIANPEDYAYVKLNPRDNLDNLPDGYIKTLEGLSPRLQRRFLHGEFAESSPSALFSDEFLDRWRITDATVPEYQRIVVAVDPSGSGDVDNEANDAVGICVAALGTDGRGYLLEDLTVKAGPATWGQIVARAYERHRADVCVAEVNYGGAMVAHVLRTAGGRINYKQVTASRGKVVRAEPIAALCEAGKVSLVGYFPELEEELAGFTTNGYTGEGSPNRADAFVWAFSELFPGMVREKSKTVAPYIPQGDWNMA